MPNDIGLMFASLLLGQNRSVSARRIEVSGGHGAFGPDREEIEEIHPCKSKIVYSS
jgi:hypothetical protein